MNSSTTPGFRFGALSFVRSRAAAFAFVASLAFGTAVNAHAAEPEPGWYIMPGPTAEVVFPVLLGSTSGATGALGGELSVVCFDCLHSGDPADASFQDVWLGGYADAVYDFGRQQTRVSFGPEIGYHVGGLDAGLVVAHSAPYTHFGMTVRGLVGVGAANAFLRASYLPQHHGLAREVTISLGFSLKLPVSVEHGFDFL